MVGNLPILVQDDTLVVGPIPLGTERLFVFVNGAAVWSELVTAAVVGDPMVVVPLTALSETAFAVDSGPLLVQAYGVDTLRQETASGERSLSLPIPRPPPLSGRTARGLGAVRSTTGDGDPAGRLFASSVHRPGDIHRWNIPLSWLSRSNVAGEDERRPIHFALRFRCDSGGGPTECNDRASAVPVPLATIAFALQSGAAPCGAEAVFTVHRGSGTAEVLFEGTLPHWAVIATASVRMVVSSVSPAGDPVWRYAVYGTLEGETPIPSPPPPVAELARPTGPADTRVQKRALLVGVSRYRRRSPTDLEFCNEDVGNWYRYLTGRGFRVEILGDEFSKYPVWHGAATVLNVRSAVQRMVAEAGGVADHMAFVVSSHGSGDMRGDSYICLLPDPVLGHTADERTGVYHDYDIAADLSAAGRNAARNFIFFDLCLSGGIIPELLQSLSRVVGTTTATRSGVGYDSQATHSGAWTHYFLKQGLEAVAAAGGPDPDLVEVFQTAHRNHTKVFRKLADRPCFFASDGHMVYNTEPDHATCYLPHGTFMATEWL